MKTNCDVDHTSPDETQVTNKGSRIFCAGCGTELKYNNNAEPTMMSEIDTSQELKGIMEDDPDLEGYRQGETGNSPYPRIGR